MASIYGFLSSSIGRKKITALTALGISLFVLIHMSGNLLLLGSAETYNRYSHTLITNPLLPIAQIGLIALFLLHVAITVKLTIENRVARGKGYLAQADHEKKTSFTSKTAIFSGAVILVFIVLHLLTFKFGPVYKIVYNGDEMRDLYRLVVEVFQEPGYLLWYLFALVLLGFHLSHGIAATFQSLGIGHVTDGRIRKTSALLALFITLGFCIQPLFLFFYGV